ncbi:hypothetical protein B23_0609 [Geobacillus thermoleovorans B23]|nr:hypothetical protein B23_0609 [Geobacillus thermoleovorans B23]
MNSSAAGSYREYRRRRMASALKLDEEIDKNII